MYVMIAKTSGPIVPMLVEQPRGDRNEPAFNLFILPADQVLMTHNGLTGNTEAAEGETCSNSFEVHHRSEVAAAMD
jgi:hypothetical protein